MSAPRLFTGRFLLMCSFSFTVFLSAFQLFPTAPFRVRELGGGTFASGLFLACLTYASALSAPVTGGLADRIGRKRTILVASLVITGFSLAYALLPSYPYLLALAVVHGVFWSALLSASSAYMTSLIPTERRAEGLGYWGMAPTLATAVAPGVGFGIYRHGWGALCASVALMNLGMAAIAWRLREPAAAGAPHAAAAPRRPAGSAIEWGVLRASGTLFLYAFGFGAVTSFSPMFAESIGVAPKGIFLTVLAAAILVSRPFAGTLADRYGAPNVLVPCLALIAAGLALLAEAHDRTGFLLAAIVFGLGMGSAYPVFAARVLDGLEASRWGAAFGAMLAAFDTGIGTGSMATGWIAEGIGYPAAFRIAALLAALAIPHFLLAERERERSLTRSSAGV